MPNCASIGTPMTTHSKLDLDFEGILSDQTLYCIVISSLVYLSASRPDIMFATCMCALFQAKPTELHITVVKRIFHNLKGTIHLGLCYGKEPGFRLTTFLDADNAGCNLDRRSTS